MQSQQTSTGVTGSNGSLSNPMTLVAIMGMAAFVGVIAVGVGWFLIPKLGGGDEPVNPTSPAVQPSTMPSGGYSYAPGFGSGSGYGAPAGAPAASGATASRPAAGRRSGPGVPTRSNAFDMNSELKEIAEDVPRPTHTVIGNADPSTPVTPALWQEMESSKPRPTGPVTLGDNEGPGPPIPAMRMAAVQRGAQVSAVVQIGGEYFQVTPGRRIPDNNPTYYVERIEDDRVVLVRRWEINGVKGVQRIEVTLQGAAPSPGGRAPGSPLPGAG